MPPIDEATSEIQTRKISVTFERKKDLGDYQNVVARVWLEDNIPADATKEQAAAALSDLLNVAKAVALDHLGIECLLDDNGVIREQHEPVPTVKAAEGNVRKAFPNTSGIRIMNAQEYPDETIPPEIVEVCNQHGITAVWAKRGKYGMFFKEAVKSGEKPKLPDPDDPTKGAIIRAPR